jgi:hypothetical protein
LADNGKVARCIHDKEILRIRGFPIHGFNQVLKIFEKIVSVLNMYRAIFLDYFLHSRVKQLLTALTLC